MCSGSPGSELDWACDDCFGRYQEHTGFGDDFEFCPECKNIMERRCFCCNATFDSPNDVENGICQECMQMEYGELYEKDFHGILEFGQRIELDHGDDPGNCMTGGACPICTKNDEEGGD
jgi:hypothetical protein